MKLAVIAVVLVAMFTLVESDPKTCKGEKCQDDSGCCDEAKFCVQKTGENSKKCSENRSTSKVNRLKYKEKINRVPLYQTGIHKINGGGQNTNGEE